MVKIRIGYKGEWRTFYTRCDWKSGKKLYLHRHRSKRLTGYWYTDPAGEYMSWQDYEREYAEQQRNGLTEELTDDLIAMQSLVEKYNDEILTIAKSGVKHLSLDEFLEQKKIQ